MTNMTPFHKGYEKGQKDSSSTSKATGAQEGKKSKENNEEV